MEQQNSNVGGQVAGMAQSGSGQLQNASQPGSSASTPAASLQADLYAANQPAAGAQPSQNPGLNTTNQNNNDASNTTVPSMAEDSDLIEKEWVEKAKAIVEKTRRDPFTQSLELNQLKTDYLQKRYGKKVETDGQ